ncbi:MAG: hypothetical protein QOH25_781 [Acidobacteriota bacterium]|jgi:gamma-glutamylcyclotransferase (GGCT)/AIG2-like uncharacterized protein YtfP|nr:hypothetical protein [Acidobacteriota bacterium]
MTIKHLFVYGTLLSEQASPEVASLIRRMGRVGPATTKGRLYDLGEYPGAIVDPSAKTTIYGEVYQLPLDKDLLNKLDQYEEYDPLAPQDSLFVRTNCFAKTFDGRTLECWVYTFNGNVKAAPLISSGNYAELKAS